MNFRAQALREHGGQGREIALAEAATILLAERRVEAACDRAAEQALRLTDAVAAECYLYDPARRTFRCVAAAGHGAVPAGMVTDDAPDGDGVLAYPLVWEGETHGLLVVRHDAADRAPEPDLVEVFARLAAVAIHNAQLLEASVREAELQRGFYRIASAGAQPGSEPAALDAVAEAVALALEADAAVLVVPDGDGLELIGAHKLPERAARALADVPLEGGVFALITRERRTLVSRSLPDDERFDSATRGALREADAVALLAVPVAQAAGDAAGVMIALYTAEREVRDEQLRIAHDLAEEAARALERRDVYAVERRSRALAEQLARIGSVLATALEPAAILDEVARRAPALLEVDASSIRLLEGDELVGSAASGDGAAAALGARVPSTEWLAGEVIQSRAAVAIDDVAKKGGLAETDPMLAEGYRAYVGVPLQGPEGALYGVLAVYARAPRVWRREEIGALEALAGNAAVALSNAELYERVALEKERSFAILANIADGIVAVDRDGRVVLWNAAAEHITGVAAGEALGRTPGEVLQRSLESDGDVPLGDRLVSIRRPSGEEVWLSLTEAVMRDPAGAVAGRIFAFRDISSERFVEQMKSDFVSTVSHELRTPLTSIYGFAETLLREDVLFSEEDRTTFLRYIASESERLTRIVDALLSVARVDAGDLHVSLVETDIEPLVAEVVADAQGSAGLNGHRFVVEMPSEPVRVDADREKLRQVIANLVDNAVKYSPDGGTVTVAARRNGETVELSVDDEGIGIPPAEQERVFRKFYRGDVTPGRGASGTGLGLFIAEGLVTAMGGRIWVESRDGGGSRFAFELPAARAGVRADGE